MIFTMILLHISVFSFCLIYCVWNLLSAGCKVVVSLICGVRPQWVELDQCLVSFLVGLSGASVLVGRAGSCLSKQQWLPSRVFWNVCGFVMSLGRLSAKFQIWVPILLWFSMKHLHWSLLDFGWDLILVFRCRPLGELSHINIPWDWKFSAAPMAWAWVFHLEVQAWPFTIAPRLHKPYTTGEREIKR